MFQVTSCSTLLAGRLWRQYILILTRSLLVQLASGVFSSVITTGQLQSYRSCETDSSLAAVLSVL